MGYFDRKRKKIVKPRYIRGLEKSISGVSKATLEESVGAQINHLEITGNTLQNGTPSLSSPVPIENANDNGMSVVLHGKNLALATDIYKGNGFVVGEEDGRKCVIFQNDYISRKTIVGGFKPNTQYTISFDAKVTGSGGMSAFLCWIEYTDGSLSWDRDTIHSYETGGFKTFKKTSVAGKTIKSIGSYNRVHTMKVYIDINTFGIYEGAIADPIYEPYFRETVEIPTSIDVGGTSLPLTMSKYDKLVVDREDGKVTYLKGGYYKTLNGNESMGSSTTMGKVWVSVPYRLTGSGYCNQYEVPTDVAFLNGLSFGDTGIAFSMSKFSSTSALEAFLKEKYDSGTPVTVLAEMENSISHDITGTALGQELLALNTGKGTNYFEISSALDTPFKLTYYSEDLDDTIDLKILYLTSSGSEVQPERTQRARKGSKYLVIAPHIDGYTRVSSEVYGVADDNTTIELIYKEG